MADETCWTFTLPDSTGDTLLGMKHMWQVYKEAVPDYTGRVTVPACSAVVLGPQ